MSIIVVMGVLKTNSGDDWGRERDNGFLAFSSPCLLKFAIVNGIDFMSAAPITFKSYGANKVNFKLFRSGKCCGTGGH